IACAHVTVDFLNSVTFHFLFTYERNVSAIAGIPYGPIRRGFLSVTFAKFVWRMLRKFLSNLRLHNLIRSYTGYCFFEHEFSPRLRLASWRTNARMTLLQLHSTLFSQQTTLPFDLVEREYYFLD